MKPIVLLLGLAAGMAISSAAEADQHCCNHCGCEAQCGKVCRLVCETKLVTKTIYDCKCEDFCIPGPSSRSKVCMADCCDGCRHKTYCWTPGSAHMRTRKVLAKTEIRIAKPSYRRVVEDLCQQCQCRAVSVSAPPSAEVPLPPLLDARIVYPPNPVVDTAQW